MTIGNESESHNLILTPGHLHRWKDLKVTLLSLSIPPLPVTKYQFLYNYDNGKMAKVVANEPGSSVCGLVGSLQCPNFEKAQNFKCKFPMSCCQCQAGETNLDCFCQAHTLEKYLTNTTSVLPLAIGNQIIRNKDRKVYIRLKDATAMQLQVTVQNMKATVQTTNSACWLSNQTLSVSGYYMCTIGARVNVTCYTSFSEVLVKVVCKSQIFYIGCDTRGKLNEESLYFDHEVIDENCVVICPKNNVSFVLAGKLFFVENNLISNFKRVLLNEQAVGSKDIHLNDFGLSLNTAFMSIIGWIKNKVIILLLLFTLSFTIFVILKLFFFRRLLRIFVPERNSHQKQI